MTRPGRPGAPLARAGGILAHVWHTPVRDRRLGAGGWQGPSPPQRRALVRVVEVRALAPVPGLAGWAGGVWGRGSRGAPPARVPRGGGESGQPSPALRMTGAREPRRGGAAAAERWAEERRERGAECGRLGARWSGGRGAAAWPATDHLPRIGPLLWHVAGNFPPAPGLFTQR